MSVPPLRAIFWKRDDILPKKEKEMRGRQPKRVDPLARKFGCSWSGAQNLIQAKMLFQRIGNYYFDQLKKRNITQLDEYKILYDLYAFLGQADENQVKDRQTWTRVKEFQRLNHLMKSRFSQSLKEDSGSVVKKKEIDYEKKIAKLLAPKEAEYKKHVVELLHRKITRLAFGLDAEQPHLDNEPTEASELFILFCKATNYDQVLELISEIPKEFKHRLADSLQKQILPIVPSLESCEDDLPQIEDTIRAIENGGEIVPGKMPLNDLVLLRDDIIAWREEVNNLFIFFSLVADGQQVIDLTSQFSEIFKEKTAGPLEKRIDELLAKIGDVKLLIAKQYFSVFSSVATAEQIVSLSSKYPALSAVGPPSMDELD